jgi:DNA-binding NarL/FixJ family response regulator
VHHVESGPRAALVLDEHLVACHRHRSTVRGQPVAIAALTEPVPGPSRTTIGAPSLGPFSPAPLVVTGREREVLALLAAGLSDADIGDRVHLSIATVKTHVTRLLTKAACNNRVQLAVLAARYGLIAGPDVAN